MIVLGIDPGLDGAAALLGNGWSKVLDLPTREDEANGRRIDGRSLAQHLAAAIPSGERVRVCIEALSSTGGWGRNSASTVGSQHLTQGTILCAVECLGLEVDYHVTPQDWKKFYGLGGKDKGQKPETARRAREIVTTFYPDLADFVLRQKDHNRAEAVLIAHWFRKVKA